MRVSVTRLYGMIGSNGSKELLPEVSKHTTGKSWPYIKSSPISIKRLWEWLVVKSVQTKRASLVRVRTYGLILLLALSTGMLAYSQGKNSTRPWKGYSILGNGHLAAVYSDDPRISASTHAKGIQHFYYGDYTADYIAGTSFELLDQNGSALRAVEADAVGMKNFFTTQTQTHLTNGSMQTVLCFVHPGDAAVLSVSVNAAKDNTPYRFEALLRKEIKTDQKIALESLVTQGHMALAVWSNGTALAILPRSAEARVTVNESSVSVTGRLSGDAGTDAVLLIPGSSKADALSKVHSFQQKKDLESEAKEFWDSWMSSGKLPAFKTKSVDVDRYLEAYKRNLYCVKSADLRGQIPADITGQFVTNNMPQLYPRDAMMCARTFLATGHAAEAKQIIEFWAKSNIPMKTPGEWYARYDAHGKAVDAGSGARFDEPEWDSNGYYLYLLDRYHATTGVWLASPQFIYKLADFLVSHLSPNGLLWEGGIVEWTGFLPATNMIDAAGLRIAERMAREFGDSGRSERYRATAQKISAALPEMFDKTRQTYADVRFTGEKASGGVSLTEQSGQKTFLWDTTANVGVIWGFPDHREIDLSNVFYDNNTVKLGGGMQYFDSPDPGLASYGHGVFFFTTAAAAEYQSLYGNRSVAKNFIDWMMRNANSYGLMPEHILPDGSDCSPASPLSWCCAEFAAALLLWSS